MCVRSMLKPGDDASADQRDSPIRTIDYNLDLLDAFTYFLLPVFLFQLLIDDGEQLTHEDNTRWFMCFLCCADGLERNLRNDRVFS